MTTDRRGTVLVAVAGLCALLAALALAFLARMRQDGDETDDLVRETQARVMLVAGCDYVLESSRLGWDDRVGLAGAHREAYGWIDVRTGAAGPLDQLRRAIPRDAARFPTPGGRAARCPMQVRERPPFAVGLTVCYNPIAGPESADFGKPLLTRPDPQPVIGVGDARTDWEAWRRGDPRPRAGSTGMSWFRCYRHADRPAVFTITCGAGGTLGFQDWPEVVDEGAQAEFGDQASFEAQLAVERRLWYDVEWSAAIAAPDFHLLDNEFGAAGGRTPSWGGAGATQAKLIDNYYLHAINASRNSHGRSPRCQIHNMNPVGSIRWVQRLDAPPANGKW